jgi:hypothetical protein
MAPDAGGSSYPFGILAEEMPYIADLQDPEEDPVRVSTVPRISRTPTHQ